MKKFKFFIGDMKISIKRTLDHHEDTIFRCKFNDCDANRSTEYIDEKQFKFFINGLNNLLPKEEVYEKN